MADYALTPGIRDPVPQDPWAGFLNMLNPFAWLTALQGTQLNPNEILPKALSIEEGDQITADINSLGLFGNEGFTQAALDSAFKANAAGNPQGLMAIRDRIANEQNYKKSYGSLEQIFQNFMAPDSPLNSLISTLQEDVKNPMYSDVDIQALTTQNAEGVIRNRDVNLDAAKESLAGRGILESGITTDLVTHARQTADELISRGNINIPLQMREANRKVKMGAEGLLGQVAGATEGQKQQLGLALGQLRKGENPTFNPNAITEALQSGILNRELLRYTNAMTVKGAANETKEDSQRMFEDMMSVFGMFGSGGGAPKPKSGGGGGATILGTGGSFNTSCVEETGIVITPEGPKHLNEIDRGDLVLTPNGFKMVLFRDWGFVPTHQRDIYLKFITNKRPIIITASHKIAGKPARDYKVGDKLPSFCKEYTILRIEYVPYCAATDLRISGSDQYFVNGICVDSMCNQGAYT